MGSAVNFSNFFTIPSVDLYFLLQGLLLTYIVESRCIIQKHTVFDHILPFQCLLFIRIRDCELTKTDCACVVSIFGENCPKLRTLCVLNLSVSATFATVFTNGRLRDNFVHF